MAARVQITFRSGAQIEADVESFTRQVNGLRETAGYKWETPPGAKRTLMDLDPEHVVAIVFIEEGEQDDSVLDSVDSTDGVKGVDG